MVQLMKDQTRVIIDDFAKTISERKTKGSKPAKDVINFRDEKANGIERPIYEVPIELLRYRKDNGRIADDVLSYEKINACELDEATADSQKVLFDFLYRKDPDKTEILKKAIQKDGQTEPAIITCDGFLINGNRRRMVLELLHQEDPTKYGTMKVIILPDFGEEGGPPTIKEIELLENRYQLQQDGKSEYSGINRALSIKRKIECGISLEEQLQDDPSCAGLSPSSKEFKKKVEMYQTQYLRPLQCADTYLEILERPGYYDSIGDRWQAFIDYSSKLNSSFLNPKWQAQANLDDNDIGRIQDVAFKIIRKQNIKGANKAKLHQRMRDLPKLLLNQTARDRLFDLNTEVKELETDEILDSNGNELEFEKQDIIWGNKNEKRFARCINEAYDYLNAQKENESPLSLAKSAYKKLTHENMKIDKIPKSQLNEFLKMTEKIMGELEKLKDETWAKIKNEN